MVASIPQSKRPKTGSQEEAVSPCLIQTPKTHNHERKKKTIKLNSSKFKIFYFTPLRKCKECAKTILTYNILTDFTQGKEIHMEK